MRVEVYPVKNEASITLSRWKFRITTGEKCPGVESVRDFSSSTSAKQAGGRMAHRLVRMTLDDLAAGCADERENSRVVTFGDQRGTVANCVMDLRRMRGLPPYETDEAMPLREQVKLVQMMEKRYTKSVRARAERRLENELAAYRDA